MSRHLFICHGNNHNVGQCTTPMYFTFSDVYQNRMWTADLYKDFAPDFLLDITEPLTIEKLEELGTFDFINARCCPGMVLYNSADGWIRQTFENVASLLNKDGKFMTGFPQIITSSIAKSFVQSMDNESDFKRAARACAEFLESENIPLELISYGHNSVTFRKTEQQSGGGQAVARRFLATLNSLHRGAKQFRSVRSALRKAPVEVIDVAFNVLSVTEGLRDACLVHPVPARWEPPSILNVHMHRLSSIPAVFIARHPAPALAGRYDDTRLHRPDPKVERFVGKWLGYIHPGRTEEHTGTVELTLNLPGGRPVPLQYGPQAVGRTSSTRLAKLHRKWDTLAKRLHPDCAVTVDLRLE